MTPESIAWYVFGGLVFISMGVGLACGAEEKAEAAAEWGEPSGSEPKERRADPRLVWGYRGFGLIFCAAGTAIFAGLFLVPDALSALFHPLNFGGPLGLVIGLALMSLGSLMAVMKVLHGGGLLYRWTRMAETVPVEGLRKRVSRLSGWLVIAIFVGQGINLVRLALAG